MKKNLITLVSSAVAIIFSVQSLFSIPATFWTKPSQSWQELTVKLASLVHNNCSDHNTGQIELTVFGGNKPYTYQWTKDNEVISTSKDITGLSAGKYKITVTDAKGRTVSKIYTVNSPDELSFKDSIRQPNCKAGISTGSVWLKPKGGVGPYRYEVYKEGTQTHSSSDGKLSGLHPGRYDITLVDSYGCRFARSIIITCK